MTRDGKEDAAADEDAAFEVGLAGRQHPPGARARRIPANTSGRSAKNFNAQRQSTALNRPAAS
jgi:hypothetical protein